jgi:hypothetical protein
MHSQIDHPSNRGWDKQKNVVDFDFGLAMALNEV